MDARLLLQDIQSSSFMTQEKKYLLVDLFVKWRIVDFEKFFNASQRGNIARAENLLQQKILDSVRTVFSRRTVKKVISADRLEIMQELLISIKVYAQELGIDVIDARIKRIEFPDTVKQDVFHRMSTERTAEASKLRAEGVSEANAIRAAAEATIRIKLAEGRKTAQTMRGTGEAEAAQIYATGYNQDAKFFEVFRSLAAYEKSFSSKKDILVVKPNGEFFKFFKTID
jgi:membrane protease subunit HflC